MKMVLMLLALVGLTVGVIGCTGGETKKEEVKAPETPTPLLGNKDDRPIDLKANGEDAAHEDGKHDEAAGDEVKDEAAKEDEAKDEAKSDDGAEEEK